MRRQLEAAYARASLRHRARPRRAASHDDRAAGDGDRHARRLPAAGRADASGCRTCGSSRRRAPVTTASTSAAARKLGIAVTNSPSARSECVGRRRVVAACSRPCAARRCAGSRRCARTAWMPDPPMPSPSKVWGKRIGILGLGAIGKAVARRAEGFAMDIAYHARHRRDGRHVPRTTTIPVALARDVKILVVAVPGGATARGPGEPRRHRRARPRGRISSMCRADRSSTRPVSSTHWSHRPARRRGPRRVRGRAARAARRCSRSTTSC